MCLTLLQEFRLQDIVHVVQLFSLVTNTINISKNQHLVCPVYRHGHLKYDSDSSAKKSHRTQSRLNGSNLPTLVVSVSLPQSFPGHVSLD